jgi:hypothetical protein
MAASVGNLREPRHAAFIKNPTSENAVATAHDLHPTPYHGRFLQTEGHKTFADGRHTGSGWHGPEDTHQTHRYYHPISYQQHTSAEEGASSPWWAYALALVGVMILLMMGGGWYCMGLRRKHSSVQANIIRTPRAVTIGASSPETRSRSKSIGLGSKANNSMGSSINGSVGGTVVGSLTGEVGGEVEATYGGDIAGHVEGRVAGDMSGNVGGHVSGKVEGRCQGEIRVPAKQNVNLKVAGKTQIPVTMNGYVEGEVMGSANGLVLGNLKAFISGDIKGDVTGSVQGPVKGDVAGAIGKWRTVLYHYQTSFIKLH